MKNNLKSSQAEQFEELDIFTYNGNRNIIMIQNTAAGRILNTMHFFDSIRKLYGPTKNHIISVCMKALEAAINEIYLCLDKPTIMTIESEAIQKYFTLLDECISAKPFIRPVSVFIQAILSFLRDIYMPHIIKAIDQSGLDADIGYYHNSYQGGAALAYDIEEELCWIPEGIAISAVGLNAINAEDFEERLDGTISLNEVGQKRILEQWQEKMKSHLYHPYEKREITHGMLPVIQANLLKKYICGEIKEYPNFVLGESP